MLGIGYAVFSKGDMALLREQLYYIHKEYKNYTNTEDVDEKNRSMSEIMYHVDTLERWLEPTVL